MKLAVYSLNIALLFKSFITYLNPTPLFFLFESLIIVFDRQGYYITKDILLVQRDCKVCLFPLYTFRHKHLYLSSACCMHILVRITRIYSTYIQYIFDWHYPYRSNRYTISTCNLCVSGVRAFDQTIIYTMQSLKKKQQQYFEDKYWNYFDVKLVGKKKKSIDISYSWQLKTHTSVIINNFLNFIYVF